MEIAEEGKGVFGRRVSAGRGSEVGAVEADAECGEHEEHVGC